MLINVDKIYNSILVENPYKHAVINGLIDLQEINALITTMPTDTFNHVSRHDGSDKTYRVHNNIIYSLENQAHMKDLHSKWISLTNDLISIEYRQAISDSIGFNVNDLFIEITLKKYVINDYISPHTDRSCVPVTHVIFLNPHWEKNWGGEFCILESEFKMVKEIIPTWDNSVLFRQSENSWHSVNPCKVPNVSRIGLQVAFWSSQEKPVFPGRNE
jgi:hypothetical protein